MADVLALKEPEDGGFVSGEFTAPTPPDTLKLEYPALAGDIDRALAQGWDRDKLRKFLALRETLAHAYYKPEEVNDFLGRTEQTRQQFWSAMQAQEDDAYVRIMKDKMPEWTVRDILKTARITGMAPGMLLMNPELRKYAEEAAGERVGFWGHVRAAVRNAIAGYNQSSAGAERFEAAELRKGGVEAFRKAAGTPLWMVQDDKALSEELERRAANLEKDAKTDEADAESWRTNVRPPDSAIGAFLISGIENSGMTVMSSIRSALGWTFGGPMGGAMASTWNTWDESQREAGEAFMEALKRGKSPDEAYEAARQVRKNNLFFLPVSNYGGDFVTFGMGKVLGKAAGAITGTGFASRAARWALVRHLLHSSSMKKAPEGAGISPSKKPLAGALYHFVSSPLSGVPLRHHARQL